jgi:hypothetical protein
MKACVGINDRNSSHFVILFNCFAVVEYFVLVLRRDSVVLHLTNMKITVVLNALTCIQRDELKPFINSPMS